MQSMKKIEAEGGAIDLSLLKAEKIEKAHLFNHYPS